MTTTIVTNSQVDSTASHSQFVNAFANFQIPQLIKAFFEVDLEYVSTNVCVAGRNAKIFKELATTTTTESLRTPDGLRMLHPGEDGLWTALKAAFKKKDTALPPLCAIFGIPALHRYFAGEHANFDAYAALGVVPEQLLGKAPTIPFLTDCFAVGVAYEHRVYEPPTQVDVRHARELTVQTLNSVLGDIFAEPGIAFDEAIRVLLIAMANAKKPYLKFAISKLLGLSFDHHPDPNKNQETNAMRLDYELGLLRVNVSRGLAFYILGERLRRDQEKAGAQKRQEAEAPKHTYKQACAPHSQGTVAELAGKLNVSKSQIRAWKADGVLDQEIAKRTTPQASA